VRTGVGITEARAPHRQAIGIKITVQEGVRVRAAVVATPTVSMKRSYGFSV
jgi:hypothetical protein